MPEAANIVGPLGIIAGRGPLPCILAEAASARGLPLHIVGIRGEAREEIERFPHTWVKWGEIGKMFRALDNNGCGDLVIIGGVNRPDFSNVRLDLGAIKTLPFILSLGKGGDDHVLSRVVRFFEEGGSLRIREGSPSADVLAQLKRVPEVLDNLQPLGVEPGASLSLQAAAGEFVLEGLWAQKKIGRSDDRGFVAPERRGEMEVDLERLERLRRLKKQVN